MTDCLTDTQWEQYEQQGFLLLGRLLDDQTLGELQQRIDDIMLGKASLDYDKILMQLDAASNDYGDLYANPQSKGHKGATLDYRKIQDLEYDPLFLQYLQNPLFEDICRRVYGQETPVRCFRAMFMNKPAHKGTTLPWHQDRWNNLDRDPVVTIWTALDPVTTLNGCVKVLPSTHRHLINPDHGSGFLTPKQADALDQTQAVNIELKAGEVALLHNWAVHSSEVNRSDIARRGFSVCYMDGHTTITDTGEQPWNVVFGENALTIGDVVV